MAGCQRARCPDNNIELNGKCVEQKPFDESSAGADGAVADGGSGSIDRDGSAGANGGRTPLAGQTRGSSGASGGVAGDGSVPASGASGNSSDPASGAAASGGAEGGNAGSGAMDPSLAGAPAPSGPCPDGSLPTDEECDGLDNDCDGNLDEALQNDCGSSMVGTCLMGVTTCVQGVWSECEGAVEPAEEACDADRLDENCDGASNENCACTPGEMMPCGMMKGACRQGTQTCTPAAAWGACQGAVEPAGEICDGRADEDCDGQPDERDSDCECLNGKSERCTAGRGICMAGSRTCADGEWGDCKSMMSPGPERCDGMDTDCDGSPDNGATCSDGLVCMGGRCVCRERGTRDCTVTGQEGPCVQGEQVCSGGEWGACHPKTPSSMEVCDGVDNDCDGEADDGACSTGRPCMRSGSRYICAVCSEATAASDCTEQTACTQPSCNDGQCEYLPAEHLTPCIRPGQLEGFCRSGSCDAPAQGSGNRMNGGEALEPGEELRDGTYNLLYQSDGNLVMYNNGTEVIWASNTDGREAGEVVMQPDGNLVIYTPSMGVNWASNTDRNPGAYLVLGQNSLEILSSNGSVLNKLH